MAQTLVCGVTHYPGLTRTDERMALPLQQRIRDAGVPAEAKDPASWPEAMRVEWGDDEGASAASKHRARCFAEFSEIRRQIDDFGPSAVIVVGDDQYENFQDDIIPPFCGLLYDDLDVQPWKGRKAANAWGEPEDFTYPVRGARGTGRKLVAGLLSQDFDLAYAYEPLHKHGLPHSIINTLLFLDHDRRGFDVPVIPLMVNCYGSRVVSHRGGVSLYQDQRDVPPPDPPGPRPGRCFALGAALARVFASLDERLCLIVSSSWSHGFLTDKHWRLRPDDERDAFLLEGLRLGQYRRFAEVSSEELEQAGQQEVLNWCVLAGFLDACAIPLSHLAYIPSYVFNSGKCFAAAIAEPKAAVPAG